MKGSNNFKNDIFDVFDKISYIIKLRDLQDRLISDCSSLIRMSIVNQSSNFKSDQYGILTSLHCFKKYCSNISETNGKKYIKLSPEDRMNIILKLDSVIHENESSVMYKLPFIKKNLVANNDNEEEKFSDDLPF